MNEALIALIAARILAIHAKNLIETIEAAKQDGKITANEIPVIILDSTIKTLDTLIADQK